MEGLAGEDHLEPVELRRVVRAGDLQPSVGSECRYGEIQCWSGQSPDVDGGATGLGNTPANSLSERRTGRAVVPPDRDDWCMTQPLIGDGGKRMPQRPGKFRSELSIHQAADIVLSENGLGDVHGLPPRHCLATGVAV